MANTDGGKTPRWQDEEKPAVKALADKGKTKAKTASVCKMFSLATGPELLIFAFGVVGAIGNGMSQPVVCLLFGNLIDSMGANAAAGWDAIMADMRKVCLQMTLCGIGASVCAFVQGSCFALFVELQVKRMRIRYLSAVLHKDVGWFDLQEVAQLPNQINEDVDTIAEGFGEKLANSFMSGSAFIGGYICAFVLGWQLALVMMSILPVIGIGMAFSGQAMKEVHLQTQSWYGQAAAVVEECLYAMRTVVAFGGERRELAKFTQAVVKARRGGVISGLKAGIGLGWIMLVLFLGYALAFYYGATLRYEGKINPTTGELWKPGQILSIFFCIFIGSFMVASVPPGVKAFQSGQVSGARFFSVLESPSTIERQGEDGRQVLAPGALESFELREVHFSYPARPEAPILRGLSLQISRGQKVAVVGESGSGKSTVISLLERFYDPSAGQVLINGQDIRSFSVASLRRNIGYVGQEPVLFATSIRENILQGSPGASEEDLERACREAQLTFVDALPEKLDTFVGSGGSQFSGGQKQRIAIARALLKRASFLFLDEATSALDNVSEKMIQGTIDHISQQAGGLGIVSIAHRLSTVKNADLIYVLSRGVVAEQGTHATLMKAQGLYYALAASQLAAQGSEEDAIDVDDHIKELTGVAGGVRAPKEGVTSKGAKGEPVSPTSAPDSALALSPTTRASAVTLDQATKEEARQQDVIKHYKMPLGRLLGFCKPELPFIVPAFIGSVVDGASMPVMAVVLVESMDAFFYEREEMMRRTYKICIIYIIVAVSNFVGMIMMHYSFAVIGEAMTQRLRVAVLSALFRQEIGFHDDPENTPGMQSRALEIYAFRVAAFIKSFGAEAGGLTAVIVGLVLAFTYCWQMALVMLASLPVMGIAHAIQALVLHGSEKKENEKLKHAQQVIADSVQNTRTVHACGCEKDLVLLYSSMVNSAVSGHALRLLASSAAFGFSAGIRFYVMAGGFYFASHMIQAGNADFKAVMTAFMGLMYAGIGAGRAASMVTDGAKAKVAAHDMFKLLDRTSAIDGLTPSGSTPAFTQAQEAGRIEFSNVRFHYPFRAEVKVLKGVNFVIYPGQSVGLVGPSGGGKSTVMSLLQRFYDPMEGAVLIGHARTPLRDLNIRWWRRQVGFVGQEPVLFNTTVRANVLYGLDDGEVVSEEWLEQCKKMANLSFLDVGNGQGWETQVGPRGSRLSGGQKQRVAICRALVRNPPVLLLDEATSALDTQSEKVVQEALEVARQGRTSFAIAHRLSTIAHSDVILVVGEGVIIEKGTHTELMALGGVYHKLQMQSHA